MGKLYEGVESHTQAALKAGTSIPPVKQTLQAASVVGSAVGDAYALAGRAVLLTLSKSWIGIGLVKPAKTDNLSALSGDAERYAKMNYVLNTISESSKARRFDTSQMYAVKLDKYFMPLSQTYTVKASKKLNISSLVDGIDIIQQTRKEAKTIDCVLKISLNEAQENLQIVTQDPEINNTIIKLQEMLAELYEKDIVFLIDNETINDTLGVQYAIMSDYRFMPRTGSKTYVFEFSLMEVKFGDNILTFDERQIQGPEPATDNGQIA